jgi:hypothetical protein
MKTRRNMLIPDRLWELLKKEAKALGISITALVLRILDEHYNRRD